MISNLTNRTDERGCTKVAYRITNKMERIPMFCRSNGGIAHFGVSVEYKT